MFPWIVGGLAVAAAALLFWLLSQRRKAKSSNESTPKKAERKRELSPVESRKHALIEEIASRISFSTAPVVLERVKVGEAMVPVDYPSDDIDIRPMHRISSDEMRRLLPGAQALDDDTFYSRAAARQLPVFEHQERVDVIRDITGDPHNVLVVIVDISPSMKDHGRIMWARHLIELLIERAVNGNADVALLRFDDGTFPWIHAKNTKECRELAASLRTVLRIGSGTNIDKALTEGFEYVGTEEFAGRKIVLITDGTQGVNVGFIKSELQRLKAKLHVVSIGQDNNDLKAVADHYNLFPDF